MSDQNPNLKLLKQKFLKALQESILLEEEEKQYWIAHLSELSPLFLESICEVVESKNQLIKDYVRAALADDTDQQYLQQLKTKIKNLRSSTLALAEKEQNADADLMLKNRLAQL